MRLRPRSGAHRWCSGEACQEIAADVAEFLDVPAVVEERTVSQQAPPWKLPTAQQLEWCRDRFGFEAMGIIPIDTPTSDVVGLAFVLP